MTKNEKRIVAVVVCIALIIASMALWVNTTHIGKASWNLWSGSIRKLDDATNYDTKKTVEDTCRAMISSYEADRLTYEQYKDADTAEKQSWAEQAKMRANKTAATYNNFILENSYVWSGNVPKDIKDDLPYLE